MTDTLPQDEILTESVAEKALKASEGTAREPKRTAGRRTKGVIRSTLISIPLIALVVWTVAPFFVTLSISLKGRAEVFSDPSLIPANPSLDAYASVLASETFTTSFWNSVIVGVGTTFLTIVIAVPAAYAFARFRFRGRHLLLLFTLLPRLVPSIGLMIPMTPLAPFIL